jgi:hypothetical protein
MKKSKNGVEADVLDITLTQSTSKERETLSIQEENRTKLDAILKITGVSNADLATFLLSTGERALPPKRNCSDTHNVMMQGLYEMAPADATEGMLCSQAIVLHAQGMNNLARAANATIHETANVYTNLATKLLRLHQETIERLEKYRRKGQQTVRVEHLHIENGAQAIVGTVHTGGGDRV